MKKYIITNNTTNTCLVFYDITKARKAVIDLSITSPYFWFLKIQVN